MAAAAGLGGFMRRFAVDTRGLIERDARALLVRTAREGNREILAEQAQRSGGIVPGVTQKVDGIEARALEQVRMPGIIRFDYDYRWEVAVWLLRWLETNSPEDSGDYRRSHALMLNGNRIEPGPRVLGKGDELVVVNTVPYSRRLEIGTKRDGSPFVIDVEPRIYERAKKAARVQYADLVKADALRILGTYVELADGYVIKGGRARTVVYKQDRRSSGHRAGATSRSFVDMRDAGRHMRYPAVEIWRR
jgi:hypothetical protein